MLFNSIVIQKVNDLRLIDRKRNQRMAVATKIQQTGKCKKRYESSHNMIKGFICEIK